MLLAGAWSDLPELLTWDASADPWAEGEAVVRLSTRIPGLGTPSGRIDPTGEAMIRAGEWVTPTESSPATGSAPTTPD
ncbi:hypothetical protein LBMAG42_05220 [Deltaproteobacteria bacterium]|nr:hypothetical protein LBMAG42_05220 [Deltaproteobacteria bacterium]